MNRLSLSGGGVTLALMKSSWSGPRLVMISVPVSAARSWPPRATLTAGTGKTIAGYGQLLDNGRNPTNDGTVRSEGAARTLV